MVEKIIINPTKVRAYGNIVNVKSDEDYEPVDCTITEDTDTVYGATVNVIVMEPDLGESTTLTVTSSSSTLVLDGTVTISATLKDSSNVAISGATITFKEGSTTLGTGTTNSSGVATYTYTGATTGSHTVSGVFGGDSTYASSTGSVGLTVNKKSTSTSLTTSSASVTVGTSVTLTATVTSGGTGVNGLTVTFKDGTSTLGTGTTNSSGIATYTTNSLSVATHSITAVVTETGTYATSTSSAVSVVVSDVSNILWQPAMDGTDSMSNFGTGTRYVDFTDGVCTCAKYCFSDSWDNSIDWEMTFDLNCNGAYSNANNGVEIIESTQTAPDHYCLAILADSKYFTNYIPTTTAVGETISNIAKNTWVSIRVTKVGTTLTVYFNDTLFETYTNCEWSRSKLAFHSWGSNYTQVKNIIVEAL